MVLEIISIILFFVFSVIGGFHIYWLFGGLWGLKKVIPTKGSEPNSLSIPKFAALNGDWFARIFIAIYTLK